MTPEGKSLEAVEASTDMTDLLRASGGDLAQLHEETDGASSRFALLVARAAVDALGKAGQKIIDGTEKGES